MSVAECAIHILPNGFLDDDTLDCVGQLGGQDVASQHLGLTHFVSYVPLDSADKGVPESPCMECNWY